MFIVLLGPRAVGKQVAAEYLESKLPDFRVEQLAQIPPDEEAPDITENLIIPDVAYRTTVEAYRKDANAEVVHIYGNCHGEGRNRASDPEIPIGTRDFLIANRGSLDEFKSNLDDLARELLRRHEKAAA